VLYQTGNYKKAEKLYSELVLRFQKQTTNPAVNEVVLEAMMILSNISIQLEKDDAAVEWLEKVLDSNPQHIGTLNDLGYLWADQNQHLQRATVMIETAVHAQPENQSYRDSLGWVYYRLGDFKRAQIELEKAAAGKETDGVILDHLGDTYLQLQDKTKARQLWNDAIKAFDPQRDAQKIKATQHKLTTTR
jgi:tetratricopeptide (TPR) repeat protein